MARVYFASAMDDVPQRELEARYRAAEHSFHTSGHELLNDWDFYELDPASESDHQAIVERDLAVLRSADAILADMSRPEHKYVGCICEIVYARLWGLRVGVIDPFAVYRTRLWLRAHGAEFFDTFSEPLAWLDRPSAPQLGRGSTTIRVRQAGDWVEDQY